MRYGLIGEKLTHSFSKEIHTRLCGYDYELKELKEKEIQSFFEKRNFSGINITIPYKTSVIKYLDYIDDTVKQTGAVNTVVNRNGKLCGYNTDAFGLGELIKHNNIDLCGKKVLILGSGGTSKTALFVANSLGAKCVLRVSRTVKDGFITYEQARLIHNDTEVIINTTPCGMYPNAQDIPIDILFFEKLEAVVDVIYNPLKTRLVLTAQELGIDTVSGLYMLVLQAYRAAELFTDETLDIKKADFIYKELLSEKQNIVLIGMPSCGKTTIGKALSERLNMPFFDSDEQITEKTGRTPKEIISCDGEKKFREIESKIISELSLKNHCVIATGGGAPTVYENISALKANGKIYFIDRPIDLLKTTPDRPLSSNKTDLLSLYNKRINSYRRAADVTVKNNRKIEFAIDYIRKDFNYENFSA